jgi:hypothetical protein
LNTVNDCQPGCASSRNRKKTRRNADESFEIAALRNPDKSGMKFTPCAWNSRNLREVRAHGGLPKTDFFGFFAEKRCGIGSAC